LISFHVALGQHLLSGKVLLSSTNKGLSGTKIQVKPGHAQTETDAEGAFQLSLPSGNYHLHFIHQDLKSFHLKLNVQKDTTVTVLLDSLHYELGEVEVQAEGTGVSSMERLKTVEGTAIYEGKKTEVIVMKEVTANLASNNARQVFAKVPGLNIWESDCAGLQLGIGARGLSPNRTSNFNTRQNGYDISADALGYPESYYSPPLESVERIEVVRGAASLQYGPQFGGMINFKMKQGGPKPIELISRQTLGSYGFFNSFNSLGGAKGKFQYYAFYQHKQGDCWRPNSGFDLDMGYASVTFKPTDKIAITADYTRMTYLQQMSGGLTDKQFATDPRQSNRTRNWFRVNWSLFSLSMDYKISPRSTLNTRFFGIYSGRDALGNLGRITNPDDLKANRNLIMDTYFNLGNETRFLHRYMIGNKTQVFVVGGRIYRGQTTKKQGDGSNGKDPDLRYLHPDSLENSDFSFPGRNYSLFAEHVFYVTNKLSITPGARFEYISTSSQGYYTYFAKDGAGNVLLNEKVNESKFLGRHFFLFGLGLAYKQKEYLEFYANASQNYRSVGFTDIRVVNANYSVSPNIKDESGYTIDIGGRGTYKHLIQYDVSVYYVKYKGRIGEILKERGAPTYDVARYLTNVADSRTYGIEAFGEINVLKLVKRTAKMGIPVFASLSLNDARYINSEDKSFLNKHVELVPSTLLRCGAGFSWGTFRINYQYSYIGEQFTDASNALSDPYGVYGLIPAYSVMDLSAKYGYKFLIVEAGINNLLDQRYFTRRAEAYPGPGIIPAEGRMVYLTLGVKI